MRIEELGYRKKHSGFRLRGIEQTFYTGAMSPRSRLHERIPVLNAFIRQHGRAPTLDELRALFQVRSKNTASVMAGRFVEAGVLGRTATGRTTTGTCSRSIGWTLSTTAW